MNTGQMLFAIGALTLLSFIVLRVNSNILYSDIVLQDSKDGILANSIAASIVEKASRKFFDDNTTTGPVPIGNLTPIVKLGPESGETGPDTFNDFDDFNNYAQQDTFYGSMIFYSKCKVCYVKPDNPDSPSNQRTWNKKLSIETYSRAMNGDPGVLTDTFKLSTIYSYWYFQ